MYVSIMAVQEIYEEEEKRNLRNITVNISRKETKNRLDACDFRHAKILYRIE